MENAFLLIMLKDVPSSAMDLFGERIVERRARQRVNAKWPLLMWREQPNVIYTSTVNVSSQGFLCVCRELPCPGQEFKAILEIPNMWGDRVPHKLVLYCDVEVVRVEQTPDIGFYGVACRIINFSVLSSSGQASTFQGPAGAYQ